MLWPSFTVYSFPFSSIAMPFPFSTFIMCSKLCLWRGVWPFGAILKYRITMLFDPSFGPIKIFMLTSFAPSISILNAGTREFLFIFILF